MAIADLAQLITAIISVAALVVSLYSFAVSRRETIRHNTVEAYGKLNEEVIERLIQEYYKPYRVTGNQNRNALGNEEAELAENAGTELLEKKIKEICYAHRRIKGNKTKGRADPAPAEEQARIERQYAELQSFQRQLLHFAIASEEGVYDRQLICKLAGSAFMQAWQVIAVFNKVNQGSASNTVYARTIGVLAQECQDASNGAPAAGPVGRLLRRLRPAGRPNAGRREV